MWSWIQTDVLPLDRKLAESIAELPHFEGDRPWDSAGGRQRMQWLSRLCDEGRFYPPRWATTEFQGTIYRVNGGTSSHMLIQRNGSFPKGLSVLIDRFVCETREDVADLFDQFDHRKSIRTLIQKVRAHKPAEQSLANVSPTTINVITTGIGCSLSEFRQTTEEDKVRLIHQYPGFIAWAAPLALKKHLQTRGVVSAIFDTYNKDAVYARGFWDAVAEESHPNNSHPTRKLASFLKSQMGKGNDGRKFTDIEMHIKCRHAWNAARRNATTELKLYKNSGIPSLA